MVGVSGAFIYLRTLTSTSYLSVYYAPTISDNAILWRDVLYGLDEIGFQFKIDIISAIFVFIVVVVVDICLVVYEFRGSRISVALF